MTTMFGVPPRNHEAVVVVYLFLQIIPFKKFDKHRGLCFRSFILAYNVEKDQKLKFLIN